ncbi:MAG: hypothetical protein K0B10_00045 [Vicingaceae bacterium]|nr:hypothetical protein [Vicingaceae bacterium]
MIKLTKRYFLFFLLPLLLMACPYQTKIALTDYENAIKYDKNMVGEWVAFHEDGNRDELIISKLNNKVVQVNIKSYDKTNRVKDASDFRVFGAAIGEDVIYNLESKDGFFMFAKLNWDSKNEFSVRFIENDFAEQKITSDSLTVNELTSFIKEHQANENFFEVPLDFYRKYSPEYEKIRIYMKKSGF